MDRGSSLRDKIYINAVLSTVNLISSNVNLIEVYIDEDKKIIEFHFSLSHINNVELGLIQDIVDGYIDAKTDAAGEEVSSEFDFKVLVSENGNSLSRTDRRYMPIYGKCDAEYFKARNNDDYVEEYVKKKIVFL